MKNTLKRVISFDAARTGTDDTPVFGYETECFVGYKGDALLITRDSLSLQWAPRWLQNAGLTVRVARSAEEALRMAAEVKPNLMIADTAQITPDGGRLLNALREVHGKDVPLIALCMDESEVAIATDADVTDIARRPFDWQVIMHRATRALRAHQTLAKLREARDQLETMQTFARAANRKHVQSAEIDKVTHLPNGDRFRKLLHRAIGARCGNVGVMIIGLDRYRMVNEAVGRENGNRLLQQVADRLRDCLRNDEVVGDAQGQLVTAVAARFQGARFALLISDAGSEAVMRFNQAIQECTSHPFEVEGQSIYLTVSVGAAIFAEGCSDAESLIHGAESAMLEAQESGTGFQFFTQPTDSTGARLLSIDRMLREAIRNDDLELAYQPITDTATGAVVAAEALLRWHHAEEGAMSPSDFVPVAEKTGLMREIGKFVIRTACGQLRSWLDAGMPPIRMAVNLSLCQLLRGDVASLVEEALHEHRLDPGSLEIELSERGVLNRRPEVIAQIGRLKDIGVRISIDDFGTGEAAIGYLKDLPIDVIKIDRSYVSGSSRTERDEAIASGMVALAHRLKATVVAEGVETPEQLEMLRSWGSQECQGFLFSPAVPPTEFVALVAAGPAI